VPGVVDDFNNGFCLYKASEATDALLAAVEHRMIKEGFSGDQTPFNEVLRSNEELQVFSGLSGSVSHASPLSIVKPSNIVAAFGAGVVGYLRTWTHEGFPGAKTKELLIVDSTQPEILMQWSPVSAAMQDPIMVQFLVAVVFHWDLRVLGNTLIRSRCLGTVGAADEDFLQHKQNQRSLGP